MLMVGELVVNFDEVGVGHQARGREEGGWWYHKLRNPLKTQYLGHSNKMLCFWLSGFFNSDAGGWVIIIIIMGGCGLRD